MPRAVVSRKGKLKRITPPIRYHGRHGGDAIVEDSLVSSRKLTRKEMNFIAKKAKTYGKKQGINVVVRVQKGR